MIALAATFAAISVSCAAVRRLTLRLEALETAAAWQERCEHCGLLPKADWQASCRYVETLPAENRDGWTRSGADAPCSCDLYDAEHPMRSPARPGAAWACAFAVAAVVVLFF